jgi:hypothetical protein
VKCFCNYAVHLRYGRFVLAFAYPQRYEAGGLLTQLMAAVGIKEFAIFTNVTKNILHYGKSNKESRPARGFKHISQYYGCIGKVKP